MTKATDKDHKERLSREQVKHIAKLAKLELSEEEIEKFQHQLSDVLAYFNRLQELDTTATEPTYQVTGQTNILREDEVRPSLSQEEALSQAKRTHNGYFLIKGIFQE